MNKFDNVVNDKEIEELNLMIGNMISMEIISFILGSNTYLHKEIDSIYYKDEYKYFSIFREKEENKDIYNNFPIEIQEYAVKTLSIFNSVFSNADENYIILKLLKKGYKTTIRYLQDKNNHYIDLNDIYDSYIKRNNIKTCNSINFNIDAVFEVIISIFMISIYPIELGIEYVNIDLKDNSQFIRSTFSFIANTLTHKIDISKCAKEYKNIDFSNNIDYCLFQNNSSYTIDDYFNMLIAAEEVKYVEEHDIENYKECFDTYTKIRFNTMREGLFSKYIGLFTGLLRTVNIEPNILTSKYSINNKEIKELLTFYNKGGRDIKDEKIAMYIVTYLFLKCLSAENFKLKDLYFNNSKIKSFEKYKNLSDKYNNEKSQNEALILDLKRQVANLESKNNNLLAELERLKLDNKKLSLEIKDSKFNKIELEKLRNFAYQSETFDNSEIEHDSINLDYINSKKIIIIGGRTRWHNKLKEVLNNCSFVSIENINFDVNTLYNYDYIFIYTDYLAHKLYYKVINYIRDNNLNIGYLKSSTNIDLTLNQLQSLLKS